MHIINCVGYHLTLRQQVRFTVHPSLPLSLSLSLSLTPSLYKFSSATASSANDTVLTISVDRRRTNNRSVGLEVKLDMTIAVEPNHLNTSSNLLLTLRVHTKTHTSLKSSSVDSVTT
jgi:hypothetical protein